MKLPLSWLKDYVDVEIAPEELMAKLFSCGFEVEECEYVGKNIEKIVVCRILKIEKHPNADKLSVCAIDAGKWGKLQIVTSAKNIAEGDLVPVALDNATLANGEKIYNGELRGVPSNGMFCSGEELGITDDFYDGASVNGILILREDYPLGEEVKKVLGIEDVVFDINVTANRPDCQCILGLAREVAAVLGKPLKMPDLTYSADGALKTSEKLSVANEATDLCPRYIGHYVGDVVIGKSPKWMTKRLASVGIRSINNIVDITNFVLTEIGQPMHAFDYNHIGGKKIVVRRARDGEKITTLDKKEFTLSHNNLVICDAEKPVALAGVMGGLNSEIEDDTKEIVFEAAKFARDNIRKTSRALGQRSDSSARYEKGIDAYTAEIAMNRALHLISELGCGKIACDGFDVPKQELKGKIIETSVSKVNGVLGIEVPAETIAQILGRLNFECEIVGDKLTVTAPLYREDVESYQDLAEEVIREYGYEHIKPTLLPSAAITNGGLTDEQKDVNNVKDFFCRCGYNEIITYSFVSEKEFDLYSIDKKDMVKILNPLGEDIGVMRKSLLPSMVSAIAKNLNRKNDEGRLFELACVYETSAESELPKQPSRLAFGAFGKEDFFTVKGVVQALLKEFSAERKIVYKRSAKTYLHPTVSADVYAEGVCIGSFGALHPMIAEKSGIDKKVFVGEFDYELLAETFNKKVVYKAVSKYPAMERDIAVTVDEKVLCGDLMETITKNAGEHIGGVKLFDIYRGDQVAAGKKSMAFNLVFSSLERTLTVEEIDAAMQNVLSALKAEYGAELR
ncbi:MAG: phenylalanine--tRNA ligase subunit beta [Bacillota bacterium]|nr:MAG: phenylalanine--tRNA ligase subunit beta [Bacillota bacterium]